MGGSGLQIVSRLHIGAGRLERLAASTLPVFLDKTWLHLGSPEPRRNALLHKLFPNRLYKLTNFQEFYFRQGDGLPLADESMSYIFSEHFFEHLFPEEAEALFAECYRVLRPMGVIRTCVPDAELRPSPEPVDFPPGFPPGHPAKHKVRWNVYSLTEMLAEIGFSPAALQYCTRDGQYVERKPSAETHAGCLDELVFDSRHITRPPQLVVDGIKR